MNKSTSRQDLDRMFQAYLQQAKETPFSGWNFEYLTKTNRMKEAPIKWCYYNIVLPWLLKAETLLDMGTGGGELLSTFSLLPANTYATEQYKPNVIVARKELEPLGVKVIEIEEEKSPPYNANLPFANEFFDLIINRHEAYYPPELKRIMKSNGLFITQQVGNKNAESLVQLLTGESIHSSNWNMQSAIEELQLAGFKILQQQEDIQFYRFYDIGAVAYLLRAIPWMIEDFSIDKCKDKLWELHMEINKNGYYDTPLHRFIIVSQK